MRRPVLLRGADAIADHLGMTTGEVQHLHQANMIPTWRAGGTPYATVRALDEWQALERAGELPRQ